MQEIQNKAKKDEEVKSIMNQINKVNEKVNGVRKSTASEVASKNAPV